jgi:inhibitor of KinA
VSGAVEPVRVSCSGDAALVLEFPSRIDVAINDKVTAIADELRTRWGAILRDVVVGYCTVTVYYDPLQVDAPWLEGEIWQAAQRADRIRRRAGAHYEVPVCYEASLAPDLAAVAAFGRCSPEEVVHLHTARPYRVYMIGFVPGFAYMAEVDARIAVPRRAVPRPSVPAGAVAIAGPQTGIYPFETPGGWHIIGRTPLKPWDPERSGRFLFHPGDSVQFVGISRDEYERSV